MKQSTSKTQHKSYQAIPLAFTQLNQIKHQTIQYIQIVFTGALFQIINDNESYIQKPIDEPVLITSNDWHHFEYIHPQIILALEIFTSKQCSVLEGAPDSVNCLGL